MGTHKTSQESKEKIAKSACRLFARKGYANASLEEIATLAGFSKGAVYHFFRSKEALLISLLHDIEERSVGRTATLMKHAEDKSAMQKLTLFSTAQANWASRNADDLAILIWVSIETANQKSAIRNNVRRIYERIEKLLIEIVEEGVASGEFPKDLPVQDTVTWITAVHDGNMLLWYRSGRDKGVGNRLAMAAQQAMQLAVRNGFVAQVER